MRRKIVSIFLVGVLIMIMTMPLVFAQTAQEEKEKLENQLSDTKEEKEEIAEQKNTILGEISKLNDQISEYESQIKELNTEIEALNDNLDLATQKAYENWKAYTVNDAALASLEAVDDKTEELTREQRLTLGIDDASIATVQDAITYLLREQYQ